MKEARTWIVTTLAGLGICLVLGGGYYLFHLWQIAREWPAEQLELAMEISFADPDPETILEVLVFGEGLWEDESWSDRMEQLVDDDIRQNPSPTELASEESGLVELEYERKQSLKMVGKGSTRELHGALEWRASPVVDCAGICEKIDFGRVLVFDPEERWALVDTRLDPVAPPWPGPEARARTLARLNFEAVMIEYGCEEDWCWFGVLEPRMNAETLLVGLSGIELNPHPGDDHNQIFPGTSMLTYEEERAPVAYSQASYYGPQLIEWIERLAALAGADPPWVPDESRGWIKYGGVAIQKLKRPEGYEERGLFLPLESPGNAALDDYSQPVMPLLVGPLEDREAYIEALSELGLLTRLRDDIAHLHIHPEAQEAPEPR